MKKKLQVRAFGLRPGNDEMHEDLATVNEYLQHAEIHHAFAVQHDQSRGATLMFIEQLRPAKNQNGNRQSENGEIAVSVEQTILDAKQTMQVEKLKAWRSAKASEMQMPVFMILPNLAIENIVKEMPESLTQLTAIKGMGPIRSQKYGKEILEIISDR
jgi:ribonuclease D